MQAREFWKVVTADRGTDDLARVDVGMRERFGTVALFPQSFNVSDAGSDQKDLADIARLIEAYPALRLQVPEQILSKLI